MDFVGLISFEDGSRLGVKETIVQAAVAGIWTISQGSTGQPRSCGGDG